eukprot:4730504-Alexandrium_andersonii.AAC.1
MLRQEQNDQDLASAEAHEAEESESERARALDEQADSPEQGHEGFFRRVCARLAGRDGHPETSGGGAWHNPALEALESEWQRRT